MKEIKPQGCVMYTHYGALLLALFLLGSCSSYEKLVSEGWEQCKTASYEKAEQKFSKAKRKEPDQASANTGLSACIYMTQRDRNAAIDFLVKAKAFETDVSRICSIDDLLLKYRVELIDSLYKPKETDIYEQSLFQGQGVNSNEVDYQLSRLYALTGDTLKARSYMEKLYRASDYLSFARRANTENDFYNLRNDLYFKLWSNGLQRLQIKFNSLNAIVDLDPWDGVTDPLFVLSCKENVYYSYVYKNRDYLQLNNLSIIEDFSPGDEIDLAIEDYDLDEFLRTGNDPMGNIRFKPFNVQFDGSLPVSYDGNKHADFFLTVSRSYGDPQVNEFAKGYIPGFSRLPTSINDKTCFQIGMEGVWQLYKLQLKFLPFLFVTVAETCMAQTTEATIEGVRSVTDKYLKKSMYPLN